MAKVSVTYKMPEDDSPAVSMGGVRFFDGIPVDLDEDVHGELLGRLRTNQHFDVGEGSQAEAPPPASGAWQ